MKHSSEIQAELDEVQNKMIPLIKQANTLALAVENAKSREFIAANNITKDDVEMSEGDDKPCFVDAWEFGKWLAVNSKKPWAEWNGLINHSSDLINGKLSKTNAKTDHLP